MFVTHLHCFSEGQGRFSGGTRASHAWKSVLGSVEAMREGVLFALILAPGPRMATGWKETSETGAGLWVTQHSGKGEAFVVFPPWQWQM